MTIEQNPPEAAVSQQPSAPQGQSQGPSQGHRRRRRRRKGQGGSNAAKAQAPNQANGQNPGQSSPQPSAQVQQPPPQNQQHKGKSSNQGGRFFHKNGQQGNGQSNNQGNGQSNPGNGHSNNPGNGSNNQGGGGRKKAKPRRQQTFVGPMDHSYRVVNGNMADAPPSTMEYRSNANGNGNGNGYFAEPVYVHPVATAAADDAPTRIYCFIEDLFFLAKIQETARKLGVKVGFVKGDKETVARIVDSPEGERPSLIVFDLNNAGAKPLTLIPKLKAKLKRGTSVIGFLSHLQGDLKVKALEAGCDMVMPRSAFSQNLPNLLRRHGLDEELEAVEA
ncbi:MAG TPA: response regulator [Acidisarcina sp.]